jgi:hypothetical protein
LDQTAQFLRNIKNDIKASVRQYLGKAVKSFSRPKTHKETIVVLYIPCLHASLVVVSDEVGTGLRDITQKPRWRKNGEQ